MKNLLLFKVLASVGFSRNQNPSAYSRWQFSSSKGLEINNRIDDVVQNDEKQVIELSYSENCINESTDISERIYSRSGVYLLVGCLTAFTGVAIFYSPLFKITSSTDVVQRLLDYLPRFGALFFIEFIAFFFLKQYRIMLEEYKYYEAIKRKRQDNFTIRKIIEENKDKPEILKIIIEALNQTKIKKLANGGTTEIFETKKMINQDMDIYSKVTELIRELKSKQKLLLTPYKINCWFQLIYESPLGLSICDLFTNFSA